MRRTELIPGLSDPDSESPDGMTGKIIQTGFTTVTQYRSDISDRKINHHNSTHSIPTCLFIDDIDGEFKIANHDLCTKIIEAISLRDSSGTYINAWHQEAFILSGSVCIYMPGYKKFKYRHYMIPPEGIRVKITDQWSKIVRIGTRKMIDYL